MNKILTQLLALVALWLLKVCEVKVFLVVVNIFFAIPLTILVISTYRHISILLVTVLILTIPCQRINASL
jgi:hypothetical protein